MSKENKLKIVSNTNITKQPENQDGYARLDNILDAYEVRTSGKILSGRRKGLHVVDGGKK